MHIPTRIEEDRVEAFWSFMGDPQATRFMALTDEQKTYEGAKALLEMVITSYAGSDPICALAITEKHTGADVGSCGLSPLAEPGEVECYTRFCPKTGERGMPQRRRPPCCDMLLRK